MTRLRFSLRNVGAAVALTALFYGIPSLDAHQGVSGVVKDRMDAMSAMGAAMKKISQILRGGGEFNRQEAVAASETVRTHAKNIVDLFPKGSFHPPSEAKPVILTEWNDFKAHAEDLNKRAEELVGAAMRGDAAGLAEAFRSTGKVCSTCHRSFRAKQT